MEYQRFINKKVKKLIRRESGIILYKRITEYEKQQGKQIGIKARIIRRVCINHMLHGYMRFFGGGSQG
jgi:hypothetical protein